MANLSTRSGYKLHDGIRTFGVPAKLRRLSIRHLASINLKEQNSTWQNLIHNPSHGYHYKFHVAMYLNINAKLIFSINKC